MRGRWNAVPEISGGGVIIDNGTHAVDIARYLLGPIREVIAAETRRIQALAVEDTAQILFRTEAGATGTIDLSWSLDTGSPWYCTLDGTKGSVRLGWATAERRRPDGTWETIGSGYSKVGALAAQVTDFCRALRDGTPPLIGTYEANASVAVIDAAYTSMRTRSWERVIEERRRQPRVA
jgi:predicted dehydrogenase